MLNCKSNLHVLALGGKGDSLLLHFLDTTNHVEGALWEVVVLAVKDGLEASKVIGNLNITSSLASEDLSNIEGLREELLDLTGTSDGQLISLVKLVHTKDSNDISKVLVVLEGLLDALGSVVMLFANNTRIKDTRVRVKRIHRWVDSKLCNWTGKHSGGVQMSESGGCSNTLLEPSKISSQGWLITDSGWDTSKKGRHLRVSLGESEDVVNKEKHILSLEVTEVLGDCKSGKSNTST